MVVGVAVLVFMTTLNIVIPRLDRGIQEKNG